MNNHCNKPIKGKKNGKTFIYYCEVCGQKGEGKTQDDAWGDFMSKEKTTTNNQIILAPRNPNELPAYIASRANEITALISPVVNEKPAMKMLISRNIRYVQKADQIAKCWNTEHGQASIITAMEDALILGAELGKMGDLVPYGDTCEFIPAVEAYEFALTNGKSAPFNWLKIEAIHENDIATVGRKEGNFFLEFENMGRPRGDVEQVAVYGEYRDGQVLGELYDASRLLEKMAVHSTSYRYFLQDVKSAEIMKSEGKLETENGREYFVKTMPKRGGGSWDKKVYLDELTNPYEGADQPEMLRKAAGKSFLRKYARVRNAEAAMSEMAEEKDDAIDDVLDSAFSSAMSQFDEVDDIVVETEVVEDIMDEADYHEQETVDYVPENEKPVQNELEIDD